MKQKILQIERKIMKSKSKICRIMVMRHGESVWNREHRWAGWSDVPLSPTGITQAKNAAKLLHDQFRKQNHPQIQQKSLKIFDQVYVSSLSRTSQTADVILSQLGYQKNEIPVNQSWRLNEKHYGILQGQIKKQAIKQYGEEQVNKWRRSIDLPPPPVEEHDPRHPLNSNKYKDVEKNELPSSQSLKDVLQRFRPLWDQQIKIKIADGKKLLIIAYGSSIRAMNMLIMEDKTKQQISKMQIPNAIPIIYHLDDRLMLLDIQQLGNMAQIRKKIEKIQKQTNLPQ